MLICVDVRLLCKRNRLIDALSLHEACDILLLNEEFLKAFEDFPKREQLRVCNAAPVMLEVVLRRLYLKYSTLLGEEVQVEVLRLGVHQGRFAKLVQRIDRLSLTFVQLDLSLELGSHLYGVMKFIIHIFFIFVHRFFHASLKRINLLIIKFERHLLAYRVSWTSIILWFEMMDEIDDGEVREYQCP